MFRKQYIRWYFNSLWAYCPPVTHYQVTPAQDDSSASCHIYFCREWWLSNLPVDILLKSFAPSAHLPFETHTMDWWIFFLNFHLLRVWGTQHACGIQSSPLWPPSTSLWALGTELGSPGLLFVCRATLQLLDSWILRARCVMVYWWSLFCPLASIHFKACLNFSLLSEGVSHSSFNLSSK